MDHAGPGRAKPVTAWIARIGFRSATRLLVDWIKQFAKLWRWRRFVVEVAGEVEKRQQ